MKNNNCPKCKSDNVSQLDTERPYICGDCGHEWFIEEDKSLSEKHGANINFECW